MEEEIIIRLNDSASVLDAEMTAIRVALENASETRDTITKHTDSLTTVNILNTRKLDINTITSIIRDVASRLTQRPTINWIPAHTGIPGHENADQTANRSLQLDRIHATINASTLRVQTRMKEQIHGITMSKHTLMHHNKQKTTGNYTRLTAQEGI